MFSFVAGMRKFTTSRRGYLAALGTSSLLGLAGCTTGGSGGGSQEITPGTAPGFPPFEFKNDDNELVGFDIDLLAAVVEPTDYTLGSWEELEFSSLIPGLQNDRIDVIAAAMTITEDRDETIDFSDPYYNADQSILVASGGDFSPSALDDLAGQRLGAQEGTTGESVIMSELVETGDVSESNYNAYGSYVLAVEDLVNGNIDAIVIDQPVAQTFASQRDVSIAFTYETGERYGFGVRTDDDDLQEALNSGLATVQDDGTYEEIRNEWFSSA
jgi:polar amino acid transport system substrate-binding protein